MSDTSHQHGLNRSQKLTLGGLALAGGIIAAPYLLPAPTSGYNAGSIMAVLHGDGLGTGLAGGINMIIDKIPLIGHALATNPLFSMAATAGIGIGGVLLANYLEKREKENPQPGKIRWSKVIRFAAQATSMLIALPSLITGLNVGICFLAAAIGDTVFGNGVLSTLGEALGGVGAKAGGSLIAATLPHLITCGMAIIPAGLASWLGMESKDKETPATNWRERIDQTRLGAFPGQSPGMMH